MVRLLLVLLVAELGAGRLWLGGDMKGGEIEWEDEMGGREGGLSAEAHGIGTKAREKGSRCGQGKSALDSILQFTLLRHF